MLASRVTLSGKQARHRDNRKEENAPATGYANDLKRSEYSQGQLSGDLSGFTAGPIIREGGAADSDVRSHDRGLSFLMDIRVANEFATWRKDSNEASVSEANGCSDANVCHDATKLRNIKGT
jgi:hypothetical protein